MFQEIDRLEKQLQFVGSLAWNLQNSQFVPKDWKELTFLSGGAEEMFA